MVNRWFDVDKEGLGKLIERHGKGHLIGELVQNALDERVSTVDIALAMEPGKPRARLTVVDDSPDGWRNLADAFTLFAPSSKGADPAKRGRFNLGEKFVLSLCEEACITTMTGSVAFRADGTRTRGRRCRERGSEFSAVIRMTRAEFDAVSSYLGSILVPEAVTVSYNGDRLTRRPFLKAFHATLDTEIADEDGILRRRARKTRVEIYETLGGEVPTLYEIGLPVVEVGDKWHVNVMQRVPDLNFNRDNAPPAYVRALRTLVANELYELLTVEDTGSGWLTDATRDPAIQPEAMSQYLDLRFGKERAAYDVSDPEANKRFVAQGGTIVTGGMLSSGQWENARKFALVRPAGQICPSSMPYSTDPNASPVQIVAREQWSEGMGRVAAYAQFLGEKLLGIPITVTFVSSMNAFAACYGDGHLDFNVRRLSRQWFDRGITEDIDALLIHELAHHFSGDHLSSEYHEALCRLGAKLKRLALESSGACQ